MKMRRDLQRLRDLRDLQERALEAARDLRARARREKDPRKLVEIAESFLAAGDELRRAIVLDARLARHAKAATSEPVARPARRRTGADSRLAADPPSSTRH